MKNFDFSIDGDVLTITINLAEDHRPSKSGRSRIVSTSGGNLRLFDATGFRAEKINLTVSREVPRDEQKNY